MKNIIAILLGSALALACSGYDDTEFVADDAEEAELGTLEQAVTVSQSSADQSAGNKQRIFGIKFPCSTGDAIDLGESCELQQGGFGSSQCCTFPTNKTHTYRVDASTFTAEELTMVNAALVNVQARIDVLLPGTGWTLAKVSAAPADLVISNTSALGDCGPEVCSYGRLLVESFGGALAETPSQIGPSAVQYRFNTGLRGRLALFRIKAAGSSDSQDRILLENTLGSLITQSMGSGHQRNNVNVYSYVQNNTPFQPKGAFTTGQVCRLSRFNPTLNPTQAALSQNVCGL